MAYDEALADRLRDLLEPVAGLTERKMFGGLAFLVHGHMAVSASGRGGLLLRVDPADTGLLDDSHAEPFVMRGRELDGWLHVDAAGVTTDAELARWAGLGVAYARTLRPKPDEPRPLRASQYCVVLCTLTVIVLGHTLIRRR